MSLHDIFKIHKETVLFSKGGFNVECVLKPNIADEGYKLNGFSTFIGCTFSKDGDAFFGDVFELTINLDELSKYTDKIPVNGWVAIVHFPQINKDIDFQIENAPIDRTMGTCLLRCSALSPQSEAKRINRYNNGGI
ncbi:hypothetical protein IJX73_02910 [bacterium]|nr:hypothetical protein [bacterium]